MQTKLVFSQDVLHFVLHLVLKVRVFGTLKWPIGFHKVARETGSD